MLKIIAIVSNIGLLGCFLYMSITEGFGGPNGWEIILILLIFLFPIINIAAILGKDKILGKDNLIILYFKRRSLQEKRKIKEIEDGMKK